VNSDRIDKLSKWVRWLVFGRRIKHPEMVFVEFIAQVELGWFCDIVVSET
jgi:hypothetical protein